MVLPSVLRNRSGQRQCRRRKAGSVQLNHRQVAKRSRTVRRLVAGVLSRWGCLALFLSMASFQLDCAQEVIPACNDQTWAGNFKLVALLVAVAGFLWRPVAKLVTATLPASNIRSQLPELRRDLERVKSEAEARLNQETARLETELRQLKQQKEQCQQTLAKI